jgi:hypothetical protein
MKWLKSLLVAGLIQVAAISSSAAWAQADLDRIKADGMLKIGTEGTYAPFTYHDASGALVGFDVEIGREVAKRIGVKAEFLEGKWDGLIAGLDARRYDAVINQVGITEARKAKYDFSDPYISSRAALIVRGDNDRIKSFADLKGKKSAQSLTACGDEHAILTFSSHRRQRVEVCTVKEFSQPLNARVLRRIQALRPGRYTRMGAALRHATAQLKDRPHTHRLLLVLTDGKPNDTDHYEGRHAVEDTRMAVLEARRAGLKLFGVTVDEKGRDYLPFIFGPGAYAIFPHVGRLSAALPALYRQLTG